MLEHRSTQREYLLKFFESRKGERIPLPEILRLGISQYNARILELRRQGHNIECGEDARTPVRHTWYIYHGRKINAENATA